MAWNRSCGIFGLDHQLKAALQIYDWEMKLKKPIQQTITAVKQANIWLQSHCTVVTKDTTCAEIGKDNRTSHTKRKQCVKWTAVYTYHFTITHLVFISQVHSSIVAFSMVAAIERSVVTVQFCICPVYHAVYWIQVVERNLWTIVGTLEEMYSWSGKVLFCSRTGKLWRYCTVQHCSKTTWE